MMRGRTNGGYVVPNLKVLPIRRRSNHRRVETLGVAHAVGRKWCGHGFAWPRGRPRRRGGEAASVMILSCQPVEAFSLSLSRSMPSTSCPSSCRLVSASSSRVAGRTPFALPSPEFRRSHRIQTAIWAIQQRLSKFVVDVFGNARWRIQPCFSVLSANRAFDRQ